MAIKLTNPSQPFTGDPMLAYGSFELYRTGTRERLYAGANSQLTSRAPFANSLDANAAPVQDLWIDEVDGVDIVFRDAGGNEVQVGPLEDFLISLDPVALLEARTTALENDDPLPTPPAAVSNLAASARGLTITLTWTANTGAVTVFRRDVTNSGKFEAVGTAAGNATTFVDEHLSPLTQYQYRLRTTKGGGAASNSNTASATTEEAYTYSQTLQDKRGIWVEDGGLWGAE